MMNTAIKILMPYFGTWPRWFWLFLETCRTNSEVEWLFLSDCGIPSDAPSNVKFVEMSLEDFRELASRQLQMDVCLPYPFKVCDFRPAYGVILQDLVGDADYWAWGDTDVLYGNLTQMLNRIPLHKFDILSVRSEFLSGELTFLRNCERANNLFRQSAEYQRIFTDRRGFDFEEYGFFNDRKIDSFTDVARRAAKSGSLKLCLRDLGHNDRKFYGRPFQLYWRDGQLWDMETGLPSLHYHFLDLKKSEAFKIPMESFDLRNGFEVTRAGVLPCNAPLYPRRKPIAAMKEVVRREIRRRRASRNHRRKLLTSSEMSPDTQG